MRRVILFIIGNLILVLSFAQQEDITLFQYGVKQGLSQSTVTCTALDSNQILWVGTSNGLNRIIGQEVFTIRFPIDRLQPVTIRSLCAESKTVLLIGSEEGAFEYHIRSGKLRQINLPEIKNDDKSRFVYAVGSYRIYASRGNDFIVEDQKNGRRINLKHKISEGPKRIACTSTQIFWINGSKEEIFIFDATSAKISKLKIPANLPQEGYQGISYNPGIGLTLTHHQLIAHRWSSGKWSEIPILLQQIHPKAQIHSALMSYDSTVYVNYIWGGTFRINHQSQIITAYNLSYFNTTRQSFNLYLPTCINIEKSGNLFLGTDGNGLIRINPKIKKFNYLLPTEIMGKPLNDNFVKALYYDSKGTLYFGCLNSGLLIYQLNKKTGVQLSKVIGKKEPITQIHFIAKLNESELLLSTPLGLCIYSNDKQIRSLTSPYTQIEYSHYCNLGNDQFLLGSVIGLHYYHGEKIKKITTPNINQISLIQPLDSNKFVVAESGESLYKFTISASDTSFIPIPIESNQKPLSPIYNALVPLGNLYFVASNFGLLILNSDFKLQRIISTEDGLASNTLYSMYLGSDQQLWFSSLGGISSYNPSTGKIRNYSTEYGLQSNEFNSRSAFQSPEGLIFFGGVMGINYFDPKNIQIDSLQPSIYLESIQQNGKKLNLDSLMQLPTLQLKHHETDITFVLKILEYALPQNVRLEYRLLGLDQEWNQQNASDHIRYAYIPTGNFTFQVRSCNADGVYSPTLNLLNLAVNPPYYQQLWFYLLVTLGFALMMLLIFYMLYLRTAHKKVKELKLLREIELVRLQISKEIHDDIGSGLTQISYISEQLLENATEDRTWHMSKLNKLQSLSRDLIQSMSEIVWLINPINDNLERLFIYLRISINRMLEETNFELEIDFPNQFPDLMVRSDARRKMVLLTKESVNNALKHSKGSLINLSLTLTENQIRFTIADNGKGLLENSNQLGNGLRNIKQHALDLGLNCEMNSKNGLQITLEGSLDKITQKGVNKKP